MDCIVLSIQNAIFNRGSYTNSHSELNLWNESSASFMHPIWKDNSCKILFIIWPLKA